ncbi:MAG: N-acyl amino acid synthase FeeM domain-containing protein [Burkholderiales bacterium]
MRWRFKAATYELAKKEGECVVISSGVVTGVFRSMQHNPTGREIVRRTFPGSQIRISEADNPLGYSCASVLINKMYAWKGYGSGFRVGDRRDQLTLVATDQQSEQPIGTLSVGVDSGNKLLVDRLYADEADQLRAKKCRLSEMTKFAIERHVNSKHLLAVLFHTAFIYSYHLRGATDLLIEVNPSHVSFYKRLLHFEAYGEEKMNPRVSAPSVLLWLSLDHAAAMIRQHGGQCDASSDRSLYPYFFSPGEEREIRQSLNANGRREEGFTEIHSELEEATLCAA